WWSKILCCWSPPFWWWGWRGIPAPNPVRELVQEGEKSIGADGSLSLEIDTADALRDHPDRDHKYIIQAEVVDASRRAISGEGAVKVTRQAFYAFLQSDRGYYRPNEEVVINLRCLTPDDKPVKAEGLLTISSVIFGGTDNARIEEKEIERRKIETDENGMASIRLRPEKSGQIKFKFETPDSWGGVVEGYALVWVCGKDFDGQKFRFNELEIITDKRTYQPGETAHLLINTKRANSYILFSDEVDNNHLLSWRLIHAPQNHIIVDIPIKETHRPNFFVEATVVSDALVCQQAAGICVPPEQSVLDVLVKPDKEEYLPGEKATIHVSAKTTDGKPARAQFALSVFDKSVTYIQSEFAAPIAKFFYGQTRQHFQEMTTNLTEQFQAFSQMIHPWQILTPLPPDWQGLWRRQITDWRGSKDTDIIEANYSTEDSSSYLRGARSVNGDVWRVKLDSLAMAAPQMETMVSDAKETKDAPMSVGSAMEQDEPEFAEAAVREAFADTAFWLPTLVTDDYGSATISFMMPENLTTWKINTWGVSPETQVGEGTSSAVTAKNLLVRLQAPRFFLEYDEAVISANVHNYLSKEKRARVSLDLPADLLKLIGDTPAQTDVAVPSGGEARVDWRVKVLKEGNADIAVKALTDEESDAMRMSFPVLTHGISKQIASTGSIHPDELKKTVAIELDIPEMRKPELSTLEVRYAPTLALAMMDALPYCIEYPYGCTEQTMSRFLPCVLTLKTLQNMGITLEEVKKIRGRMDEVRRINKGESARYYSDSPIFDETELKKIISKNLNRIASMQQEGSGWGWWRDDDFSPYLTSYVVYALCEAQKCDVMVDEKMILGAIERLKNWEISEMRKPGWSPTSLHAFIAYVLSLKGVQAEYTPQRKDDPPGKLIERLFEWRDNLELYGKALLSMTLANTNDKIRARLVLQNIMQYKEENAETQVVWFRTPRAGWWFWWNSDIETNAAILRAIVRLEPKSAVAPRLVKWLLNNRRNGYYWDSTRDTTLCIAAMSEFAAASGETSPDFTLTLDYDNGAVVKTVRINKDNLLTFDNLFRMEGVALGGGKHSLKITKEGAGALYFNAYLRYFTKEEHIAAAGHELKIVRQYHKLQQIPYEAEVEGSQGQKIKEKRLRYERILLKDGDTVQSGDQIQVELKITSDNDYTYMCFEDMKPAGCEATETRSGGKGQEGFFSYMELRDEKVVFFVDSIGRGDHLLRYRLRAEIPGIFHALPTILYGMYAPDLRANSDELAIKITD
ncbi:MAG TPA: alpha-2-macroglobulin family protein, partial [Candidatus Sumerlaeia bacterium]|nr:alpha-2-macroglobulin family protein [Candidatus Sumerlaeia bacterium]